MLQTITRMEKMASLQVIFSTLGMLSGGTSAWETGHKQTLHDNDNHNTDTEALGEDLAVNNIQMQQPPELCDSADASACDEMDISISLATKHHVYN